MTWELTTKVVVARNYAPGKCGASADDFQTIAYVNFIDSGVVQIEGALTVGGRMRRGDIADLMRRLQREHGVHTIELKRARRHSMPFGTKVREDELFIYYRIAIDQALAGHGRRPAGVAA